MKVGKDVVDVGVLSLLYLPEMVHCLGQFTVHPHVLL